MIIKIETKKSIIKRFKEEMDFYCLYILDRDVPDKTARKLFFQVQGVMLTWCDLYSKYDDEIYDIWQQEYYDKIVARVGEL